MLTDELSSPALDLREVVGAPAMPEAVSFEDGGHGQDEGDEQLARVLGAALDEIDAEEKAEAVQAMVPTEDLVELSPRLDTWYRRTTRAFICSYDPPLVVSPVASKRRVRLVLAVDRGLEDLLALSLQRAQHTFEERRANDARRNR